MTKAMEERLIFSQDMLYYAYYFVINDHDIKDPLQSELWKSMMKTFEEILCDTSDKPGWIWLKQYFINSLIWYLPHPKINNLNRNDDEKNDEKEDDGEDDMEKILKQTLFYELLIRVQRESKKQSDLLLKEKIDKIKKESPSQWNQLISYNITTKWSKNARQDVAQCLQPQYNESDLSEDKT